MHKARNQRLHAAKRALERYGLECTPDLLRTLRRAIKRRLRDNKDTPECAIQFGINGAKPCFRILYEGQNVHVIWDRKARRIVTFLPPVLDRGYHKRQKAAA